MACSHIGGPDAQDRHMRLDYRNVRRHHLEHRKQPSVPKEEVMNRNNRHLAFSFAEIMVAAPWAYTIIAKAQDNDKACMLQRNTTTDEGSPVPDAMELEAAARAQRAEHLAAGVRRVGHWLASAWRRR